MHLKTKSKFQFLLKWQSLLFVFAILFVFTISFFDILAAGETLNYSGNFTEAVANDGSLTGTRIITLTGDTFADPITLTTHLTVTNVPVGLTAVITRDSDTQLSLTFTGNATDHLNIHDVADLTITFLDGAFTTVATASDVANYIDSAGIVDFENQASLSYSGFFDERLENDGVVAGSSIVVTLTGDTFVNPGIGFTGGVDFTLTNVPAGFGYTLLYNNSTSATLVLTDPATNHLDANDISNLTLTFLDPAFTTEDASNVTNYINDSLVVDFDDQPYVTYSGSFTESVANDGSVTGSITLDLVGDTFIAGPLDLIIMFSNPPAGLVPQVTRNSDTQVEMSFTGNADSHLDSDDISDLTINCTNGSFTNTNSANVVDAIYSNGVVDFIPAEITYSGSFTETAANDGSVGGSIEATLTGDTFIAPGALGLGVDFTVGNLPASLSAAMTVSADSLVATLTLTGNADSHVDADDIANLTITFLDPAFNDSAAASDVVNYTYATGVIDFIPAELSYSGDFTEAIANDGSVSGSRVITLTGDTFADPIAQGVGNEVVLGNVPVGLIPVVTRDSTTQLTLTFTGNANSHLDADDISNLTTTFLDGAFIDTATASDVVNYTDNTGLIDFIPAEIVYAGDFTEAAGNDGSLTGSRAATLTGDTFVNGDDFLTEGVHFSLTNKPAGLTAIMGVSVTGQVATLTFTSTATDHADANDIANLTITFLDGAFINTATASNVTNYTDATGGIDFDDQALITYAGNFSEVSNADGSVTGSRLITITDDAFQAGIIASSLVEVTNVPAGLTAVLVRNSNIQLELTLTGNATNHLSVDDVSNLTVSFSDGAFVSTPIASNVTDYIDATAVVDFDDQPLLSYSGNFAETVANDGTVAGSRIITLAYDTFIVDPTGNVTIDNVPANLVAGMVIDSNTQLTVTLTGSAINHADIDDVSNITITFLDGAFTNTPVASNVDNYIENTGQINFADAASLSYSGDFTESVANDGTVTGSRIITLALDTFVDPITLTTHLDVTNVPVGLTAVVTRDSNMQLTLTLTGTAAAHANINDVSNLTVTFLDGAFTNTAAASDVIDYINTAGIIDFSDAPLLSYSGNFTETATNDGSVSGSRVITLASDTFVDPITLNTHLNVTNVPAGLSSVVTRNSASQLTLTLTGKATNHADANDISNLTIVFLNGAFTNTALASNVTNYTNATGIVGFDSPSGGGVFSPPPSSGSGTVSSFVDMAAESNMIIINLIPRNFVLYINSLINFQVEGDIVNSYTAKIQALDMFNGGIEILFNNGQVLSFLVGDLKEVDLNGDSQADISVSYNELTVNRIDLTFTKLVDTIFDIEEVEGFESEIVSLDENEGRLFKVFGKETVYLLENGKKRPIFNELAFNINGFNWDDVIFVGNLEQYPLGEVLYTGSFEGHIFMDGDLLKENNDAEVYLLEDGKKRHILNESIFNSKGFNWNMIYSVSDLDNYPLGEVIDFVFTDQYGEMISALFEQDLEILMRNDDIRRLQTLLASDPEVYPRGIIGGYFGLTTKEAVARFQMKYGVVESSSDIGYGRVGPATRAKLLEVFGR